MAISSFGKARMQLLREARKNGHEMGNHKNPMAFSRVWDVSTGEHFSCCSQCPYEVQTFEETNTGIVRVFHAERIDAGRVRDIEGMPKCTGREEA